MEQVVAPSCHTEQDPFGILFGLSQSRPRSILNLPRTQPALKPKGPKLSVQEIQYVQNLIERCLQWYLAEGEVIETLFREAQIEPGLTSLVWNKLLEQNPLFFRAYSTRVLLKEQVVAFNNLIQQHAVAQQQLLQHQQQQQQQQQQNAAAATAAVSAAGAPQLSQSQSPPQASSPGTQLPVAITSPPMRLPLVNSPAVKSRLAPAYSDGPLFLSSSEAAPIAPCETVQTDAAMMVDDRESGEDLSKFLVQDDAMDIASPALGQPV